MGCYHGLRRERDDTEATWDAPLADGRQRRGAAGTRTPVRTPVGKVAGRRCRRSAEGEGEAVS